ncbi:MULTISPECIES: DUF2274 domain-containing protein [Mesorhizobium]|uniref:DUF2274 domain-containing protein n=1 Tax=Mesorhizobium TaxID=68287 RepID=UPI0007EE00A8|nr:MULTISPECIES: DUF2274 domain-containing protein [Mesorhizobium]TPJ37940.1 DUF2274 domain-containing protein [Mesorhizobium sp. B2-6-6]ARP67108.1 transposase [Mesorhizobium sp. WSM1497]MCA0002154.1 DUF2274 domain-containing protein [Mesorhizobium sp. B264B2A]MCA0008855.1 DUF2274 domain-containing protein [Mesorhizobium sp. B264B1B]MCA0015424.1 DUF2274 domain-containing protein [Mesorhizobium sp. B294B1A1]
MANLKLGKLPDRTPLKITITVSADLSQELNAYAALYRQTYGESETVAELIPFMLAGFLDGDRAFAKARKEGLATASISDESRSLKASDSE